MAIMSTDLASLAHLRKDAVMSDFRTERDSMGEVQVPAAGLLRRPDPAGRREFPDLRLGTAARPLIHAMGLVKYACGVANRDLGKLTGTGKNPLTDAQVDAMLRACREVAEGKLDDEFPVDVFQTGSGTSSNMNVNEVIANRAIETAGRRSVSPEKPIHPNDHVNMGQSTNDTFPTAIHVAVAHADRERLAPGAAAAGRDAGAESRRTGTRSSRSAART